MYDQLTKSIVSLVVEAPFYGHFLSAVVREITPKVRTVAVGADDHRTLRLYVNEAYWQAIAGQEALQAGTLKHEVLHLVFGHIFRPASYFDPFLYHIAADLVVNQLIERDQLPADAIQLQSFPDLKLKSGSSLRYYYNQLHRIWSRYLENPAAVAEKESLKKLTEWSELGNWHLEKHRWWESKRSMLSSTHKRVLDIQRRQILATSLARIGQEGLSSLPVALQLQLQALLKPERGVLPWKRFLRLFANASRHTQLKNTVRRPSKRYGTTPGIIIKNRRHLLVAIDTSGSIKAGDLQAFFGEIHLLWRQGVQLTVVECDEAIRNTYPFSGHFPKLVFGRGNTAFEAPIALANGPLSVDGIVYFTDGFGPTPRIASKRPILWVISSNGVEVEDGWSKVLPGRVVKIR